MSIFQEPWWLDAVAPGLWREVIVSKGGAVIGRWPFCLYTKYFMPVIGMAPLTPTLGPWIAERTGSSVAQSRAEIEIVTELTKKLPSHVFFRQILSPCRRDAIAFQMNRFSIGVEHTMEFDYRIGIDDVWSRIKSEIRNQIRAIERRGEIVLTDDVEDFIRLHLKNLRLRNAENFLDISALRRVFEACHLRQAVKIFLLKDEKQHDVAALFCVLGHGRMHHLFQVQNPEFSPAGAMDALTWHAIKFSIEKQLKYDFDGMPNNQTARRHLRFGGEVKSRFIITRGSAAALGFRQFMKRTRVQHNENARFC
jgi:hypothetical protein